MPTRRLSRHRHFHVVGFREPSRRNHPRAVPTARALDPGSVAGPTLPHLVSRHVGPKGSVAESNTSTLVSGHVDAKELHYVIETGAEVAVVAPPALLALITTEIEAPWSSSTAV